MNYLTQRNVLTYDYRGAEEILASILSFIGLYYSM